MSRRTVSKRIRDVLPKRCCNCGAEEHLIYHHIVPVEFGGMDIASNIAVVCAECHGKIHYGDKGVISHGELVKKGMETAKENGVVLGRRARHDTEYILRTIAENSTQFNGDSLTSEREIMESVGLKPSRYYTYKRKLIEAINAAEWPYEWPKPVIVNSMPVYEHKLLRMRG